MDRGQAITLEATIAGVLLVMCVLFALQVTAVTPLTESTSSQHIENQQKAVGHDLLSSAAENGELKEVILYWDDDHPEGGRYVGTGESGVYHDDIAEDGAGYRPKFADQLESSFSDRGIAYNLRVHYIRGDDRSTHNVVHHGQPSNHAVTATQTITLYDTDEIYGGKHLGDGNEVAQTFYIDNQDSDSPVYNVVEVELIIWRM